MIYKQTDLEGLEGVDMESKIFYLILLKGTHQKDNVFILGQGIGNYCKYREAARKFSLGEYTEPNYFKLMEGEILVHEDILAPFWHKMKEDYHNKIVLPVSDNFLGLIKVGRGELTGKHHTQVDELDKDHRVLK